MTWHIVVQTSSEDRFARPAGPGDALLRVPLGIPGDPEGVSSSVADRFAELGLVPPDNALDLLSAAIGAYTADTRVPRLSGYDRWTRDMVLHLPVQNPARWAAAAPPFERMLRFLTGDHWVIQVRQAAGAPLSLTPTRPPRSVQPLDTQIVCLFSGGLDSYAGAIDQLSRNRRVALLSHHSQGGGPTSTSQDRALTALRQSYDEKRTPFIKVWVSPPKGHGRASEITTRGRSVLFLGLGVAAASATPRGRLVVPENGLISLNVPLTDSRLGSLSTRTTHPHLIALLREVIAALDLGVSVELPYRFATKGELLRDCANGTALTQGLGATMSCARPGAGRFGPNRNPNQHCGYCFPCLIRRASVKAARMADPTTYAYDILKDSLTTTKRADLRAIKMALDRYAARPPRMADVLVPGPLPGSDADLAAYLGVFNRGIAELRAFLS